MHNGDIMIDNIFCVKAVTIRYGVPNIKNIVKSIIYYINQEQTNYDVFEQHLKEVGVGYRK